MIIHLLIFSGLLTFKLWWDKRAKDSGRVINHTRSGIIDFLGYAISIYFFCGLGIFGMISVLALTLDLRWILFDIGFNLLNNDKWNHTGNSSFLDVFLDKIDGARDNLSKYGIIIKGILLCIFLIPILYEYV